MNQLTAKAHSLGFIDEKKYDNQVRQINSLIIESLNESKRLRPA